MIPTPVVQELCEKVDKLEADLELVRLQNKLLEERYALMMTHLNRGNDTLDKILALMKDELVLPAGHTRGGSNTSQ